ncbi:hypothetical protein CK556_01555 [Mesoplasma chauliocola]|uniref:Uncharacterized protein n=1 Tax=Mesoplasma chauliocola TaxID=216427 RepID=A0A249SNH2_9MOLU|nr:hypothetical protein [Mesoplasma chauliocola]ASZ09041.1 hypothetical protein CK556_01555 [Mesoplasma chauliocola]
MSETKNLDWKKARDFDLERTNIWISFTFELLFVVLPYVAIWVLIGSSWNNGKYVNFYNDLPIKELMLCLICFGYIFISLLVNWITYIFHIQKEDSFTFTIAISLCLTGFICNSIWIDSLLIGGFTWFLRILFLVLFALVGIFIGTLSTMLIRNHRFKIEEEDQLLLEAYKNGENIPSLKKIRIERAEKYRLKKQAQMEELKRFREELDNKIAIELANAKNEKKDFDKRISKLDEKEGIKRKKKNNKKNNKST